MKEYLLPVQKIHVPLFLSWVNILDDERAKDYLCTGDIGSDSKDAVTVRHFAIFSGHTYLHARLNQKLKV